MTAPTKPQVRSTPLTDVEVESLWQGEQPQLVDYSDPEPPVLPDHATEEPPERLDGGPAEPSNTLRRLNSHLPKVLVQGDDRLLGDVAAEVGQYLRESMYFHAGGLVAVEGGRIYPISSQQFRSLVERYIVPIRRRSGRLEVASTLFESEARGILASHQFRECLRPLRGVSSVRLPVLRSRGSIELPSEGYDVESQTFTADTCPYSESMGFASAKAVLDDLFSEFHFADGGRSKAVAASALLGLFAQGLLPDGALRPAFVISANCEGAGKTMLAMCCIVPVIGECPASTLPEDDAETRKRLTATLLAGQRAVLFDNVRHVIGGASLEAFCSSPVWQDRKLGENENLTIANHSTLFFTSNGASTKSDMRRRSLFVNVHLDIERAEDRTFRRPLSTAVMREMRPQILRACWSLVRHWDTNGRPRPRRDHASFPEWAGIVGGIVEAAGFDCPLETGEVSIVADEDGDGMRELIGAMEIPKAYASAEMAALCRKLQIFGYLTGGSDSEMGQSQKVAFGRLLTRFVERTIGSRRLIASGKNHGRRYQAVPIDAVRQMQSDSLDSLSPLYTTEKYNHLNRKQTAETAETARLLSGAGTPQEHIAPMAFDGKSQNALSAQRTPPVSSPNGKSRGAMESLSQTAVDGTGVAARDGTTRRGEL
jgi:hypothetical protein